MDREAMIRQLDRQFRPAVPLKTFEAIVYGIGRDAVRAPDVEAIKALLQEEVTKANAKEYERGQLITDFRRNALEPAKFFPLHEQLSCRVLQGLPLDANVRKHIESILVYGFLDQPDVPPLVTRRAATGQYVMEMVKWTLRSEFNHASYQMAFHGLVAKFEVLHSEKNTSPRIYSLDTADPPAWCQEEIGQAIVASCASFLASRR
jgi:hypothetical protein